MTLLLDYKNQSDELVSNKELKRLENYKDILIFGAGDSGEWCYRVLVDKGFKVSAFIDNYSHKWGGKIHDLTIYSFEKAMEMFPDAAICVGSVWYEEIYNQIVGYSEQLGNNIFPLLTTMVWETGAKKFFSSEGQYIREHIAEFEKTADWLEDAQSVKTLNGLLNYRLTRDINYIKEIKSIQEVYLDYTIIDRNLLLDGWIVDGGAFDGDSIEYFIKILKNDKLKVKAYEAGEVNCERLKKKAGLWPNVQLELHQAALWNQDNQLLNFSGSGLSGAVNLTDATEVVHTEKIDSSVGKVSFIKLDVEGAEKNALIGAAGTIARHKPQMAICGYHLQDDLIEIPKLIKNLNPDYKIYLRHYMLSSADTIIYAV